MHELIIIRGLPGSGKSTMARELYPDHLHYEPDHLFCDTQGRYRFDVQIFEDAKTFVLEMADFALARGENVVVTDVFPRLAELDVYRKLAKAHGARCEVVTLTREYGSSHRVPVTVLSRMREQFEKGA